MSTASNTAALRTRFVGPVFGALLALLLAPGWRPYAVLALLQILAAFVYLSNASSGTAAWLDSFPLDDGWIHMVYARSFGEGLQFSYNPGEPESGMTSPLWAMVVGAGWRVLGLAGISLMATAKVLSIALGFASAVLVMRIVGRLSGQGRLGFVAGAVVVLEPSFAFAGASGMEVTLFAFMALAATWAYTESRPRLAGLFLAFAAVARPEGYVLVGVVVAASVARRLWAREQLELINREDARELRDLLLPTLILGGAWAAYNFSVNGSMYPNTYLVKHRDMGLVPIGNLFNILRGYYHHLSLFWGVMFPLASVVMGVGAWMIVKQRRFHAAPLVLFPIALSYAVAVNAPFISGPWNFFTRRYLDASIPFLVILLVLGLLHAYRTLHVWRVTRVPADPREAQVFNFGLNLLLVAMVVLPFISLPGGWRSLPKEYSWNTKNVEEEAVAAGMWIAENVPLDARIGVGDAGATRFFGERYTYDLVGLNTNEAIGRPPLDFAEEKQLDYLFVFESIYFDSWPVATKEETWEATANPYPILGGNIMGEYRADWTAEIVYVDHSVPQQIVPAELGLVIIDEIDPGNTQAPAHASEESHTYELEGGGGTVERRFRTLAAETIVDEGRTFTGIEEFIVTTVPGERLVVVRRYDAAVPASLLVFADDQEVERWDLEPREFFFGEDSFVIPASFITEDHTHVRMVVVPMPGRETASSFYYWFLVDEDVAGELAEEASTGPATALPPTLNSASLWARDPL